MIFNERKARKAVSKEWLLNKEIDISKAHTFSVQFTVKGSDTLYGSIVISANAAMNYRTAATKPVQKLAYFMGSWADKSYRSLIFVEEPSGDLLTWLQDNGVQQ